MWFRFSLRRVLALAAVCALLLGMCVTRPTMLAHRFAAAANAQDMAAVDKFMGGNDWRTLESTGLIRDRATRTDRLNADVMPRDWGDWVGCRRRVVMRIARHSDRDNQHAEWTEDIDLIVRAVGVSISPPDDDF